MKIGLIRHFQPTFAYNSKSFMNGMQFKEWVKEYNLAEVNRGESHFDIEEWHRCYSSDLNRAIKTARAFYDGEIVETQAIREIPIDPVITTFLKLPLSLWLILGRLAWFISHKSQTENRVQTLIRVENFVSQILSLKGSNILVVSHGGIMWLIQKELVKQGFIGPKLKKAKYGKLYVYEKLVKDIFPK